MRKRRGMDNRVRQSMYIIARMRGWAARAAVVGLAVAGRLQQSARPPVRVRRAALSRRRRRRHGRRRRVDCRARRAARRADRPLAGRASIARRSAGCSKPPAARSRTSASPGAARAAGSCRSAWPTDRADAVEMRPARVVGLLDSKRVDQQLHYRQVVGPPTARDPGAVNWDGSGARRVQAAPAEPHPLSQRQAARRHGSSARASAATS